MSAKAEKSKVNAMNQTSSSSAFSARAASARVQRWALSLLAAIAFFATTAAARAVTYDYALANQTWGRPPSGGNCNGPTTTTTYSTLTFKLAGTVTISATRASGTGISLTAYQGSFFPGIPCANFWETTTVSATATVSGSVTYTPTIEFPGPTTMVVVVSGNSAADLAGITVTVTPNGGTTYELVCTSSFSPGSFNPTSAAATLSTTFTPQFGAIGCDSWNLSTASSWIKNITPSSGVGVGSISFSIDANPSSSSRSGQILGPGSSMVSIVQAGAPACAYTLNPTSASVGAGASSGSFAINTTAGCAWTASTTSPFVTGVTASGTGAGTVNYSVGANTGPARTATITAGNQTFTINQASGCSYVLSSTSAAAGASGGSGSLTVTPSNAACAWTASSNSGFITGVTASGTGTGTVNYSVSANSGLARSGTLTVAGQTFTVNQAIGCSFTVTPPSVSLPAPAISGPLTITASDPSCPWTATSNDAWLAVGSTSGTGSAQLGVDVAANAGPSRVGSLTVAGNTVTFTQASGCAASLASATTAVGGSGGSGSVTLTMSSPICAWTASSNSPWVTVQSSGTGSGAVTFTVAAHAGPARSATLTIAGQTFTINQANACTYAVTPASASVGAAAGITSVDVTASDPACPWSVASNAAWLASTTTTGTGSQTLSVDYSANVGLARDGTMTIAGQTFSVSQADGCTASIAPSSAPLAATGGVSSFAVTMSAPACAWSAATSSDFISGVTGSGIGDGNVSFSVAPNAGPARSGTIAISGRTFTVNQASGCTASLETTSATATAEGGQDSVAINMSAPTCPWTASSNVGWLSTATSGTGSGEVSFTAAPNPGLARTGTLTIAGYPFTVEQENGCTFTLASTQATGPAAGGTASVVVTASDPACPFTASAEADWLTNVTPGGVGSTTISYTMAANTGLPRTGTLTIAGQTFTVEQGTGCTATLSTPSVSVGNGGGSLSVGVQLSSPLCTWTASANQAFISNVQFDGTGSGSVTFDVAANAGVARTGTVTIAGKTVTVSQGDGCSFLIAPTGAEIAASATGPFSFALTASDASCPWLMSAEDAWVTVNTAAGTGSATLSYSTTANVGPARSSTIEAGGRTYTLVQEEGCSATVSPSGTLELSADAQASEFALTLSAQSCSWTATSNNSWLTIEDAGGTGNATVPFTVEQNTGPERTLDIQLKGGQTVTVRQASGCSVSLPAGSASAQPTGGSAAFNVDTVNGCGYTAEADVPWLTDVTVTEAGVSYTVEPSDGVARVGKITVASTSTEASAVYTITQASGCVLVLPSAGSSPSAEGGLATFEVQAAPGCGFTATTTDAWLEPVTVSDGTVSYQAAAHVGPARTGTISVTSTDTGVVTQFAVSQESGCTIALTTTELSFDEAGGTGTFGFTTAPGCSLNVTSEDDWLSSFTYESGEVTFVAAPNLDSDRAGTIVVTVTDTGESATFTVYEASGCTVTLPVTSAEVAVSGGTFSFDVDTGLECGFQVATDAPWLEGLQVIEDEPVASFTVQENTGVARTATITITDKETNASTTYVVHQAGAITPPMISGQPQGAQLVVGEALRLEVVASGGDLRYQWRKNGVDIPGATSLEYRVMSTTTGDSGSYDVVISNDAGSITSDEAVVVVSEEPPPGGEGGAGNGGEGPDNEAGAAGAVDGGGTSAGGTAGSTSDSGGEGPAGAPSDPNKESYLGGGSCNCAVVGGTRQGLLGSAAVLLIAGLLLFRRRRLG